MKTSSLYVMAAAIAFALAALAGYLEVETPRKLANAYAALAVANFLFALL